MSDTCVGALVLAGGAGRRAAPLDKLLTRDPSGRAMINRTLQAVGGSRIDAVLLVLGHGAGRLRAACPGIAAVEAADHAEGIAASLRCGIAHAERSGWDAALVCLADMPLVASGTIDRLLGTWRGTFPRPDAVVPLAQGRRGNPVLWDRRMFPSLLDLHGDAGARSLLARADTRHVCVETDDEAVLEDFDTPARLALFAAGMR
jgi:molybdenum cofactor cytidylyltransferase